MTIELSSRQEATHVGDGRIGVSVTFLPGWNGTRNPSL